jgi:hypothetical protein
MSADRFLDPALLKQVGEELEGVWRRDLAWAVQCKCSHLHTEHRPDMKTSSPCTHTSCGCRHMRPGAVVWFEHRRVYGRLTERTQS